MHELHLLADYVIMLTLALAVAWIFDRLRLPSLVGFIAAGVLLGPGGFGVIEGSEEISLLAEIGVVLLLFVIGLEVSIRDLKRLAHVVFLGGALQVGMTSVVGTGLAWGLGFDPRIALFLGLLGGLSSTAIVLTSLKEYDQFSTSEGQGTFGILLFQDLAIVPLILLVPILAHPESFEFSSILITLAKAAGVIVGVGATATYIFPWIAEHIARTRRRELFRLFSLVVAIGTAYVSGVAGLSLALGAFMAGIVISESPYSHQMLAEIEPFRDIFNSIFFVAMGLLIRPSVFVESPLTIAGLILGIILVKALIAGGTATLLGYGVRDASLIGLGLAQVGEFSFVLAKEGLTEGLMTPSQYGIFMGASVITMAVAPLIIEFAPSWIDRLGLDRPTGDDRPSPIPSSSASDEGQEVEPRRDHVIIVGFGWNGRALTRAFRALDLPYVISELNPGTVREWRDDEPIYYGDATEPAILNALGIGRARALIVTAGEREVGRRVVEMGREVNRHLPILVRTRYADDVSTLYELGATRVVAEEYESSIELMGATLGCYDLPSDRIYEQQRHLREMILERTTPPEREWPEQFTSLEAMAEAPTVELIEIAPGDPAEGQKPGAWVQSHGGGATSIAVLSDDSVIPIAEWTDPLEVGDQLVVLGSAEEVARLGRERE